MLDMYSPELHIIFVQAVHSPFVVPVQVPAVQYSPELQDVHVVHTESDVMYSPNGQA